MWGIDGAALDRWITGNWGQDQFTKCDNCEDYDECEYDGDFYACEEDAKAEAAERRWEVENDR